MHQLTCPHCGQKMKTKKLVMGKVLCPKCNKKFRTIAPAPPTPEPQLTPRERDEQIRMRLMTPLGVIFLLIGLFVISDDADNLFSFCSPFFLAPVFCGLFFLTPGMFALLRKQNGPVGLKTQFHQHQPSATASSQPVDRTTEDFFMKIFGSMALITGVIGLLLLLVALFFIIFFLVWLVANNPGTGGW
jgi:hypothetical protein